MNNCPRTIFSKLIKKYFLFLFYEMAKIHSTFTLRNEIKTAKILPTIKGLP